MPDATTKDAPFAVPYQGPHGDTVESHDARLRAYKQAALIQRMGRNYKLTAQADGSYTVEGDGMAAITFEPAKAIVVS